jgi:SAM-dependent methyltransferase
MSREENKSAKYGNWVSTRIIVVPVILALAFGALSLLTMLFLIPAAVFLVSAAYFAYARHLFSDGGGKVQDKIRALVLEGLEWGGFGKALDIGCGSGALAIGIAKKFPSTTAIGTDYWGGNWEYSQKVCQDNAAAEGTAERVAFQKASASALPFPDGEFDAVVSNLVFHEVRDTKDKLSLVKEALRVLKKGGRFALQDLFYFERLFGKPEELVRAIRGWGVEHVELVETRRSPFIPPALRLPFMVGTLGLLVGRK